MTNLDSVMLPKLIVVTGPTATGKSDLAVAIALFLKENQQLECEIISADSRQIFKYLDIGTGKITADEMCGVPHHMIDILLPMEEYSVFAFAEKTKQIIAEIHARGHLPILCGGTGQYIDEVISGTGGAPVPPNPLLRSELEQKTFEEVRDELVVLSKEKDCDISRVDMANKRRMIRAIEIIEKIGLYPQKDTTKRYSAVQIGLDTDSDTLRQRIKTRLDARLAGGMVEEAETLLNKGLLTHERMHTLGLEYRYISLLLQGKLIEAEFREQLFFAIWHYAKRQRTWLKRNADIEWFDCQEAQAGGPAREKIFTKILTLLS